MSRVDKKEVGRNSTTVWLLIRPRMPDPDTKKPHTEVGTGRRADFRRNTREKITAFDSLEMPRDKSSLVLRQGERTTFVYGAFSSLLWRTMSMKAGEGAPCDLLSLAAPFCR